MRGARHGLREEDWLEEEGGREPRDSARRGGREGMEVVVELVVISSVVSGADVVFSWKKVRI